MSAPYSYLRAGIDWPGVVDVPLLEALPMTRQIANVLDDDALHARYIAAATECDWPMVDACEAEIDRRHPRQPATPARLTTSAARLAAALWYARRGLPVFPLTPDSKIPHKGTGGFKDASTDEHVIESWWERWPLSNVGGATGHVCDVIDVDGPSAWLELADVELTTIGRARTARNGGWHLFIAPRGHGNRARLRSAALDYRGLGGYVVLAPSVVNGVHYRWVDPLELEIT